MRSLPLLRANLHAGNVIGVLATARCVLACEIAELKHETLRLPLVSLSTRRLSPLFAHYVLH
jgi:hypothetical protein